LRQNPPYCHFQFRPQLVLRPRLHLHQFGAQVSDCLLGLLAQRAFLVDLARRAARAARWRRPAPARQSSARACVF
jgi:hypothetical protein